MCVCFKFCEMISRWIFIFFTFKTIYKLQLTFLLILFIDSIGGLSHPDIPNTPLISAILAELKKTWPKVSLKNDANKTKVKEVRAPVEKVGTRTFMSKTCSRYVPNKLATSSCSGL